MGSVQQGPLATPTELPDRAYEVALLSGELLHDLNNALATLSALTEMAQGEAREGRSTVASISRIQTACGQLRRVVRDVSDTMLGRSLSGDVEFDPASAARGAFEQWIITAPAVEVSFHCELPAGSRIRGRESFLTRALSNLLRNAARHANREIRVRAYLEERDSGPGMVLTVEDDGDGIDEPLRARLFEPLVHGGHGGTGLGLSMVRWAAEQLGGSVEAADRSVLGGAKFLVRLPLRCPAMPLAPGYAVPSAYRSLAGQRVVVVDDDAAIRQLYGRLLRRSGAVAIEFAPAECRTAEMMAAHIASAAPDAVLLDAEMGAYDGVAVWEALLRLSPASAEHTLIVSGYATEAVAGSPALADRWIGKDAEWSAIEAAIGRLLDERD